MLNQLIDKLDIMKILIVAATWMEVNMLVDEFEKIDEEIHNFRQYRWRDTLVDVLVTGIGTTFCTFHLTSTLRNREYDMVINIGIAGSLSPELKIGEVLNVVSEEFADLGVEGQHDFQTLFEAGFIEHNEFPFQHGVLKASDANDLLTLRKVRGITSNKSLGRASSIDELKSKFSGHVESTEGAAVLYVCSWMGVDCIQIRAVSNYVEPRDSSEWNIPQALENLTKTILLVLEKLTVPVN